MGCRHLLDFCGFPRQTGLAVKHRSDAVAMIIVCLFKIFILLSAKLFLSDFWLVGEQIKRAERLMNQTNSLTESVDRDRRPSLSEGYAAVFATVLIWSTPSLFHVLFESLLRSVGAKFLSLFRRLPCHCTVLDLPGSSRRHPSSTGAL